MESPIKPSKPASAVEDWAETGIKFEVPGSALAAQAAERASWHRQCAESIAAELKTIGEPEAERPGRPHDWSRTTRLNDLMRRKLQHEEHARFLDFVGSHLNRERVYRVTLHELSQLEIAPKALYL